MAISKNTFTGEYSYTLDAKGRINIPSKFRQSLSKENENTFVTTRGMDKCIWIYPICVWQKIENELKNYIEQIKILTEYLSCLLHQEYKNIIATCTN